MNVNRHDGHNPERRVNIGFNPPPLLVEVGVPESTAHGTYRLARQHCDSGAAQGCRRTVGHVEVTQSAFGQHFVKLFMRGPHLLQADDVGV